MRCRSPIRSPSLAALAIALASLRPLAAAPVVPSQIVAATYQPASLRASASGVDIPADAGASPPRGARWRFVRIGRAGVMGGFSELADANVRALRKLAGRKLSLAEIFAVANALQQQYVYAGYGLAEVSVPAQRLVRKGALQLVVTDRFIDAVDLDGVPAAERAGVRRRLAVLVGRRHLTVPEIESVLSGAAAPGLALNGALVRDETPDGAKLVVRAMEKTVAEAVVLDNRLPGSLGTGEVNAAVSVNNAMGMGEQVLVSGGGGLTPDATRFAVFDAGASAPAGGLRLAPEYTHAQTHPAPGVGAGVFDRAVIRGSYDLERDPARTARLGTEIGYIAPSVSATPTASTVDADAYGFARARLGAGPLGGEPASAEIEVSPGLIGRGEEATAASRPGASPGFHKARVHLRLSQALPESLRLDFVAKGQWSIDRPLFVSEPFALDGPDALSPFPSGVFSAGAGATLRAELTRAFPGGGPVPAFWSPCLFAAGGVVRVQAPAVFQIGAPRAFAFGLGIRSQFDLNAGRVAFAAAELGREYSNEPGDAAGYRLSLNLSTQF